MRALRAALVAALAIGCGARPPLPPSAGIVGPREASVGAVRVALARRATEGHVALGVFVRAREGSAALRAVAALVLEARGAGRWRVRASPDGLAIRTATTREALHEGLASLASALAVRDASAEEVERATDHVRRRRAARAADDAALATQLALLALGGQDVDPLGAAPQDAAITSDAVSAWLAEVLGAERVLVAAVGDVDEATLHDAVEAAFASAPSVRAPEADARWTRGSARVATGTHPTAAVATCAATPEEAARIADWVERLVPTAHAASYPLRGRAVVSATLVGDEHALATLAEAFRHAHTLDDEAAHAEARDAEGELLALGDAWLARTTGAACEGLGLALVRLGDEDVAGAEEPALDRLGERSDVLPSHLDDARAEALLENGMRVRVARSAGDAVAIALSWAAGARFDPPREHGRAALLAEVLARSCEPDADLHWADDEAFGVVIRGERETIERSALRAIDCARRAATEVAHTESVRASAIAALELGDRVRAWAAGVLAPGAPGLVAPRGSAVGLAAATQLDDAIDTALDPRRATLVIVGDEPPSRLLAIGDALGSALHAGSEPLPEPPTSIAEGAPEAFVTDAELDVPIGIVALRTTAGRSERAARSVASALAHGLAGRGLTPRAFFGGAAAGTSFAVVAVSGADAHLDALPAIAAEALAALEADPALEAEDAADAHSRALALAEPAALARSLASDQATSPAIEVARALLRAEVHTVLARPTSAPFRRTR